MEKNNSIKFEGKSINHIKDVNDYDTVYEKVVSIFRNSGRKYFSLDVKNKRGNDTTTKVWFKVSNTLTGVEVETWGKLPKYYRDIGITTIEAVEEILKSDTEVYYTDDDPLLLKYTEEFSKQKKYEDDKAKKLEEKNKKRDWEPYTFFEVKEYIKKRIRKDIKEVDQLLKTNKTIRYEATKFDADHIGVNKMFSDVGVLRPNSKSFLKHLNICMTSNYYKKATGTDEKYSALKSVHFQKDILKLKKETARKHIDKTIERLYRETPFWIIRESALQDKVVSDLENYGWRTEMTAPGYSGVRKTNVWSGIKFKEIPTQTKYITFKKPSKFSDKFGKQKNIICKMEVEYDTTLGFINKEQEFTPMNVQTERNLQGYEYFEKSKICMLTFARLSDVEKIYDKESGTWWTVKDTVKDGWSSIAAGNRMTNADEDEAKKIFGIPTGSIITKLKITHEEEMTGEDLIDADSILRILT